MCQHFCPARTMVKGCFLSWLAALQPDHLPVATFSLFPMLHACTGSNSILEVCPKGRHAWPSPLSPEPSAQLLACQILIRWLTRDRVVELRSPGQPLSPAGCSLSAARNCLAGQTGLPHTLAHTWSQLLQLRSPGQPLSPAGCSLSVA